MRKEQFRFLYLCTSVVVLILTGFWGVRGYAGSSRNGDSRLSISGRLEKYIDPDGAAGVKGIKAESLGEFALGDNSRCCAIYFLYEWGFEGSKHGAAKLFILTMDGDVIGFFRVNEYLKLEDCFAHNRSLVLRSEEENTDVVLFEGKLPISQNETVVGRFVANPSNSSQAPPL